MLRADGPPAQNDLIALRNIFLESLNQISSVVVRDADYAKSARIQILLHGAERRNFRATGNAPRRPKIQQDNPPFQVLQLKRRAIEFGELHVRRGRIVSRSTRGRRWRIPAQMKL